MGLGNYNNKAFTTGCWGGDDCSVKTEILNMTTLTWSDTLDYPYLERLVNIFFKICKLILNENFS